MSLKEIEKLRERLQKDPNSKIYIPLAEEYRKIGMLDEAIEVLQGSIEKQPGYMSARVLLGKIYIEKDQQDEARIEFEQVIKAIPDNLYAHKKLAEIYRDAGNKELAMKMLRTLLKLNPIDEEALNSLRELEAGDKVETPELPMAETPVSVSITDALREENLIESATFNDDSSEQQLRESAEQGLGFDDFKDSLFGLKDLPDEEASVTEDDSEEEATPVDAGKWSFGNMENDSEGEEEHAFNPEAKAEEGGEEWSFGDVDDDQADDSQHGYKKESGEMTGESAGEWSFGDVEEFPEEIVTPEEEESSEKSSAGLSLPDKLHTTFTETDTDDEELLSCEIDGDCTGSETGFAVSNKPELLETAEKFILEEEYAGAIDAYRQILTANPEDKQTLQRMEELRSLLKLIGRDKEILVSKLNSFLNSIQKRGDEFFRSA